LDHRIIIQICECANPQQNLQRILAQEAATSANENRVNNKFPPDEPMVEHRAADEHMSERDNRNDGQGTADDPFSNSDASFMLARDDSMSSEDDDDQNDFIFDDMFGLEAMDDGTTDDGQSLETTSASRQGNEGSFRVICSIRANAKRTTKQCDVPMGSSPEANLGLG
jgi:hypothetical protein